MKSVLTKYLFLDEKYLRKVYDLFIEKISLKDWRTILVIVHIQTSSVLENRICKWTKTVLMGGYRILKSQ